MASRAHAAAAALLVSQHARRVAVRQLSVLSSSSPSPAAAAVRSSRRHRLRSSPASSAALTIQRGLASSSSSSTEQNHDAGASGEGAACCGVPGCQHRQPHAHGKEGTPCWACGKPTGCCAFFCICGKIQPVVGDCSYFETFHIPRAYDINAKELELAFFKLQKTLHPDHYGQKSQMEQDFSRSNSTYLNVAYRTLKDPTLRAKYLLQLEGIHALDERSKTADPALLMEIMELREQIEEGGNLEELRRLMDENRAAMEVVKGELAGAYKDKDWKRMVALTNRLQYLSKAHWEARERLDQLENERQQQSTL